FAFRRVAAEIRHLEVRLDTGQQLACRERLYEIIVGARLESFDPRLFARPCGEQDEWHAREGVVEWLAGRRIHPTAASSRRPAPGRAASVAWRPAPRRHPRPRAPHIGRPTDA